MRQGMQIVFGNVSDNRIGAQISNEPVSMKTKIAQAIIELVREVPKIKYADFDKVRLFASDFLDSELPAAQLIDNVENVVHARMRKNATWILTLEVVDKSDENGYISKQDMWNLEYQLARKIWSKPQLGLRGVVQASYIANSTDLHMLEPYYLLRMDFQVEYFENLTGEC